MFKRITAILLCALLTQGCAAVFIAGAVGTALVINDQRSIGTKIDDNAITSRNNNALQQHDDISKFANVELISMNRNVLVIGQVPHQEMRSKIIAILRQDSEIRNLHDQLRISSPLSLKTQSEDAWLSTKIKTLMMDSGKINTSNIVISTVNGEVFLVGLVSKAEGDAAVEIARNVVGVRKVVRVFEQVN